MSETAIGRKIQLEAAKRGVKLLRNNNGALKNERGQWVTYGVGGDGGSDYLGWKSITVTPDMVGKKIAIFVACEVKTPGGKTKKERLEKQIDFIKAVNQDGGIGMMVENLDQAMSTLFVEEF